MATTPGICRPPSPTLLLVFLFAIILPPWSNFAQAQNTRSSSGNSSPPPPRTSNPAVTILIVILVTSFVLMVFFSIYLRNCVEDDGSRNGRGPPGTTGAAERSRRAANRGLDPAVIASFPTFVYADVKAHKLGRGSLECAVCLTEFDDDEELRLLPNCSHAFHPDCIDKWLALRTTCPVCRYDLATAAPVSPQGADPTHTIPAVGAVAADGVQAHLPQSAVEDLVDPLSGSDQERREDHIVVDIPTPAPNTDESDVAPLSPYVSRSASDKKSSSTRRGSGIHVQGSRGASATAGRSRVMRPWRSQSANPAVWMEDDQERFTLRLPEYVRREIMSGKVNRSRSVALDTVTTFPMGLTATTESTSQGNSREGWSATVRWVSMARQLSSRFGLGASGSGGGDAALGSTEPRKAKAAKGGFGRIDESAALGYDGGGGPTGPLARV